MKKLIFLITVCIGFVACHKDELFDDQVPPTMKSTSIMTESVVNPQFGKPNATLYYFKVSDLAGTLSLSVKLFERTSGTIRYLPMTRIGTYWILSTKIATNGWYDWRYVYSASKSNISEHAYTLCNTNNTFSSTGISSLVWPFGSDGSDWKQRGVSIGNSFQVWRGGQETKGTSYHIGYGWNEGTHIDIDEQYSDDWNRGAGTQDFGAEIRSPLDGYIAVASGTYISSLLGTKSKYVSIVQEASDGKLYRFYVGHLNTTEPSLFVGKYVRAGVTKIGTLGMSGASSPHAHTSLRNITDNANTSVKFYFDAQ